MRLHRFYVGEQVIEAGREMIISDQRLQHQWRRVLRYSLGDRVVIFNAHGREAEVTIRSLKPQVAVLVEQVNLLSVQSGRAVWLYCSLLKKSNFEFVAQKATEVGVSKLIPIISRRTEKKSYQRPRLEAIAVEASEQSGRVQVPEVEEEMMLAQAVAYAQGAGGSLCVTDINGGDIWRETFEDKDVLHVFVGPEGGWSEAELLELSEAGARPVSLGRYTLRAETAAIVAAWTLVNV